MLPPDERAKNAHSMSLPSLRQHYLVAMATSLAKLENKVQIYHLHQKFSHMVYMLWKSVQLIFDQIRQFFGRVVPDVHKWALSTLKLLDWISGNFITIYNHICAADAHIEIAISHSVSECQRDESGEFAIFSQNRLPWQRPLRYRKKRSRSSSAPKTLSFGEKIATVSYTHLTLPTIYSV